MFSFILFVFYLIRLLRLWWPIGWKQKDWETDAEFDLRSSNGMNHPGIRQFLKCLLPKRGLTSHKTALSPFLFHVNLTAKLAHTGGGDCSPTTPSMKSTIGPKTIQILIPKVYLPQGVFSKTNWQVYLAYAPPELCKFICCCITPPQGCSPTTPSMKSMIGQTASWLLRRGELHQRFLQRFPPPHKITQPSWPVPSNRKSRRRS